MEEFEVVVSTLRMVKTGGKGASARVALVWTGLVPWTGCQPCMQSPSSLIAIIKVDIMGNEWMERVIPGIV